MRVLAACDPFYYWAHGQTFYRSALDAGYTPVIHVVNPTPEVIEHVNTLGIEFGISVYAGPHIKNHYAHSRFYAAEHYLSTGSILITDIDVIFQKVLPAIEEDVGVFIRENEAFPGMKSMAGILWLQNNDNGYRFIRLVSEYTSKKPEEWYSDQYAIYDAYHALKDQMSFKYFSNKELDWDFRPDTYIWSGKGNRKYTNQTYINRKKKVESDISILHPL